MSNKLKSIFYSTIFILSFFTFLISCSDDDDDFVDGTNPGFPEFTTDISTAPGMSFVLTGIVEDENGIENVNIFYPDWYLDKFIEFNESPKEYHLKYTFQTPTDAEPESTHIIKVSVTDVGGNISTIDVEVTLDYDTSNPVIEIISPEAGSSYSKGDRLDIDMSFMDNKELDSVIIMSSGLGLSEKIKMDAGVTDYSYTNSIEIPTDSDASSYSIQAIAIDATGNRTEKNTTLLVGEANEIPAVYAVGGSMWWEWDPSKGTQMWKDENDDKWFVLEFYYWTGYGIKFVGQLGWEPNNWGLDPNDNSKMINSQDSQEINFDLGDGYYRVKFNPYTLEYTYELMEVDVEVKSEMYIVGAGFPDYPNLDWSPEESIKMDADGWGNPYVFTAWIQISDDTSLKFIGQNDGWGPYDAGFEVGGELQMPLNFVKNKVGDGSPDAKFIGQAGWYWITFDYFLKRTTIHPYDG